MRQPPSNPILATWNTPFEVPPFAEITPDAFSDAFKQAFAAHLAEIEAIAAEPQPPSFDNTIAALERSGRTLTRVSSLFHALTGAHSNDALLATEREISPKLAAHWNKIRLNDALFARIDALWRQRDQLKLSPEQARVLARYHTTFRRAGAGLDAAAKARLAEIAERLAALGTGFSQNVLKDEQSYVLELETEDDLAGLPEFLRHAAQAEAAARGLAGKHAITLSRSSVEPFLQSSRRRDLREKAFRAWVARGDTGGETDNKALIAEMMALRTERARRLGYPTYADYRLDDAMAKTPSAVRELLDKVWRPARERALADRDALQDLIRAEGGNFKLAPWDWRYYAEKLRKVRCDLDDAELKPYLALDNMIAAAFATAHRLFGLNFQERNDVPVWHPDVRTFEVTDAGGRQMGIFFGDYFARSSKRSGAWMTTLRPQQKLDGDQRPLVINVMNFAKASPGEPTLLSLDDARTLFHEFGHALHALLSDVTYPMISGTSVLTDFVELPSQLYEHWLEQPEILGEFARHYRTGAPMPDAMIGKLAAARTFNQSFATVEYVASALVDLDLHLLERTDQLDVNRFERESLARIGMPEEIVMRHRPPHFAHIFSGGWYASAYYSYMWSEVLDADAFQAFREAGDVFDQGTAQKLRTHIYAAGGTHDPAHAYTAFRGRLPTPDALLRKRGLDTGVEQRA
ncbi:MAG: M3 family metallopeptidase [Xanthobacteraceae bacterium]|nr:M3 family metallopeptidase [Xanthobacteraceae bacterium]